MCDPWKRLVIWQNLVEKETMHYAHLEEMKGNKFIRVATPPSQSDIQPTEDHVASFNARLPSLPLAASTTGTLHHLRRPVVSADAPAQGRQYRHGFAPRFGRKRNASGGFFAM